MSGSQQLLLGGIPTAAPVDPYFYSVTSLLHGDGTNGGQNNTFLDSSNNNFTITRNGNTTQGSFSPFSQTGWGNFFDGTGDSLTFTANSTTSFTGDMTLEGWVFLRSFAGSSFNECCFASLRSSVSAGTQFDFGRTGGTYGAGNILWWHNNAVICQATAGTVPLNQWVHVAWVRSGTGSNNCKIYVNGVQVAQVTNTTTMGISSGTAYIGNSAFDQPVDGYMSNVRLTNTAVYTAAFTPPTAPLTAITGTSLLTCQANRFLDASSNNFTITRNGDVSVQPFSPFNPTTAYSTSAVGGSGYFDGSGDYLSLADNAAFDVGSGNFTFEFWMYTSVTGSDMYIFGQSNSMGSTATVSYYLYKTSGNKLTLGITNGVSLYAATSTNNLPVNAWVHIACVRDGNTLRNYINGVQDGTADVTGVTAVNSSTQLAIGRLGEYNASLYSGYISNFRMVVGTCVYTGGTSFTPPTAPLPAIANTQLLTNFTNGAIFDNAAVADYETVGNAQISTSVKKYGTGSMYFDGTGDGLYTPNNTQLTFGTGDFTIEFWVYRVGNSVIQGLFDERTAAASEVRPTIYITTGNLISFYTGGADRITASISQNTWLHIAVNRTAGVTKLYINGTSQGSYTDSNNYLAPTNGVRIGYLIDGYSLNGYIDDIRITKGVARYPYNFTPPTAEFPNIGGTVTLTADPYFDYTTLLLPGNGTNGAQNNTFLDSSTNAFSITRNGNTTQGTFSPFSQTGWGNYFDGSGDYLSVGSSTAFGLGTGDFTIEGWLYPTANPANGPGTIFDLRTGATNSACTARVDSSLNLLFFDGPPGTSINTGTVRLNTWTHVAFVRSSGSLRTYINGTLTNTTAVSSDFGSNQPCMIGNNQAAGYEWNGYISNFRLVKNTAVYTSNFTPSTTPLTAISGTSLLTCQSNRFIDNSTNNFTITRNGDVSVQAFSPFNPTAAWSAATNGGSGYFDGSGDYLNGPSTGQFAPTGNFTISMWIYPTSFAAAYYVLAGSWNAGASDEWLIQYDNTGAIRFLTTTDSTFSAAGVIKLNQWQFISISRTGNTLTGYVNGTSFRSYTLTGTVGSATKVVYIGAQQGTTWPYAGYMADFRLVAGSAESATPPTAPATAISGTNMLLNFTNAGIYDATSKNDLETVGNAQISTTQSKFGGSSMYFDGTGDYLKATGPSAPSQYVGFGMGDFTIEAWVYITSSTVANNGIYDARYSASATGPLIYYIPTSGMFMFYNGSNTISGGTITINTWTHVALVRYNGVTKLYLNGTQSGSNYTDTNNYTSGVNSCFVGAFYDGTASWNGYIDDFRVTRGIARYTSNFTPPSTAFLTL